MKEKIINSILLKDKMKSPHETRVVNSLLHPGQHHVFVVVPQLLYVAQHQLNPEVHPRFVKCNGTIL